jgi:hypothetical protein
MLDKKMRDSIVLNEDVYRRFNLEPDNIPLDADIMVADPNQQKIDLLRIDISSKDAEPLESHPNCYFSSPFKKGVKILGFLSDRLLEKRHFDRILLDSLSDEELLRKCAFFFYNSNPLHDLASEILYEETERRGLDEELSIAYAYSTTKRATKEQISSMAEEERNVIEKVAREESYLLSFLAYRINRLKNVYPCEGLEVKTPDMKELDFILPHDVFGHPGKDMVDRATDFFLNVAVTLLKEDAEDVLEKYLLPVSRVVYERELWLYLQVMYVESNNRVVLRFDGDTVELLGRMLLETFKSVYLLACWGNIPGKYVFGQDAFSTKVIYAEAGDFDGISQALDFYCNLAEHVIPILFIPVLFNDFVPKDWRGWAGSMVDINPENVEKLLAMFNDRFEGFELEAGKIADVAIRYAPYKLDPKMVPFFLKEIQENRRYTLSPDHIIKIEWGPIQWVVLRDDYYPMIGALIKQDDGIYFAFFDIRDIERTFISSSMFQISRELGLSVYPLLVAAYRDMVVPHVKENIYNRRSVRRDNILETNEPRNRRREKTKIYVPRNVNENGSSKSGSGSSHATHYVVGFLRRLPEGFKTSEGARDRAKEWRMMVPDGYTFVRPHVRGRNQQEHQQKEVICWSAMDMIKRENKKSTTPPSRKGFEPKRGLGGDET